MESVPVDPDEAATTIAASPFFAALPASAVGELAPLLTGVRVESGERLISAGEPGDSLYLVRHGRLRSSVERAEGERMILGEVGKGEVVGEMAMLTGEPRSADVDALRDTTLYRLSADDFSAVAGAHPEVFRSSAAVIVGRYRNSIDRPPRDALPATIAVLARPDTPGFDWLLSELTRALGGFSIRVVHEGEIRADDTAAELLEIESAHDIAFLIAGDEPTAWARQCLRHADYVFIVGAANHRSDLFPIEADPAAAERIALLDSVLIVMNEGRPRAEPWARNRDFVSRHNVAVGVTAQVDRLARRLTGTETVLVLSGGGARGFAHFGVIEELVASGIEPDVVCGTSAGSLVAGIYATAQDFGQIRLDLIDWLDETKWSRDFTFPLVSMMSGRTFMRGLDMLFGESVIENLDLEYFAVSTDLSRGGTRVHDRGPVSRAVRASAAIPGVFPPVHTEHGVLADGGLVDNLPIGLARQRHPSARLIAVDVGAGDAGVEGGSLGDDGVLNGWRALAKREAVPSLPKLLVRLTELGKEEHDRSLADVVIVPDVGGFGLLDASCSHEIVERGRTAAREWVRRGIEHHSP